MSDDLGTSDSTRQRRRRPLTRRGAYVASGIATVILLIAVVSVLTGGTVKNEATTQQSALVGHRLKDFTLDGLNGGALKSPWEADRASVIVFFASYCGPCKGEMPKIAKYLRANDPSPVEVLGVDAIDQRSAARAMVRKDGVTFPVVSDPNGVVTTGIFGFGAVPESVFVNAKGVVIGVHFGAIPRRQLASAIQSLKVT